MNTAVSPARVRSYESKDESLWDEMIASAHAATFLHTRRFLNYHGNRFCDLSVVLEGEDGRLVGVFPAALDPGDDSCVISHPGITYGGIVHDGGLYGDRMVTVLQAIAEHYRAAGYRTLRYKAVPHIYHRVPGQDDLYALFRVGAKRYRCDLSATIDLVFRQAPKERRKRGQKKAERVGVVVDEGSKYVAGLWRVLTENLARKFQTKPVHSLEEILLLYSLFPRNIEFVVGILGGNIEGGVVLFYGSSVAHAQYIASSEAGSDACVLDAVFQFSIEAAAKKGMRYFDFGISNENDGWLLNQGLYQFKREFGAGGVVHEFYEIGL